MNRIQRITAAAALGTAVLAPTAAAVAYAEPYPWHQSDGTSQTQTRSKAQIEHEDALRLDGTSQTQTRSKAQIEHEDALRLAERAAVTGTQVSPAADNTIPWDVVGLAAFAGAALGAGTVVGVRYLQRQPKHA